MTMYYVLGTTSYTLPPAYWYFYLTLFSFLFLFLTGSHYAGLAILELTLSIDLGILELTEKCLLARAWHLSLSP